MTRKDSFGVEQLKARLHSEHQRLIVELKSNLSNLRQRTEMAIESLKDGKALDAHLIVNAGGISELIAKWNMVRDMIPYLYEGLEKK